jgi:hypothetical protein
MPLLSWLRRTSVEGAPAPARAIAPHTRFAAAGGKGLKVIRFEWAMALFALHKIGSEVDEMQAESNCSSGS